METKLFFISVGLLAYTALLKYAMNKKILENQPDIAEIASVLFHMTFCAITGLVVGMILSTLSNQPDLITRYSVIGTCIGAGFGLVQFIAFANTAEKRSKILKSDLEWSDTSWSAIMLASILMFFVIQAFKIPSGSMRMTLVEGDHLFVNKFIYGIHVPFTKGKRIELFRKVKQKDIIIFTCPPEALSAEEKKKGIKKDFIKRAIALGGDTVEIMDKKVYVNGNLLEEPYTDFVDSFIYRKFEFFKTKEEYQKAWEQGTFVNLPIRDNFGPVKVPEEYYFVMGDNRDRSFDSRFWGPLPDRNLKGEALLLYWPPARIKIIK